MENENRRDEKLFPSGETKDAFEIDEELREMFANEADALTGGIAVNLEKLETDPNDSEARLEIRRAAHTLKGSASIVGLKRLAGVAHRVEDLLDAPVARQTGGAEQIFNFLKTAVECLKILARDENSAQAAAQTLRIYEDFDAIGDSLRKCGENSGGSEQENESNFGRSIRAEICARSTTELLETSASQSRSVVRVSLERLDDLINLTDELTAEQSIFERHFAEFEKRIADLENSSRSFPDSADALRHGFEPLFDKQQRLIAEIGGKLVRLRMVPFGSLANRLRRTVSAACADEGKCAELLLVGETLEIDTQILDCLIEPLLHLLRNAVAHGIEMPAERRLCGKPETGQIFVRVSSEKSRVAVTVADDGGGISLSALKEKAIAARYIARDEAEKMSAAETFELMFLHGLTTDEKPSRLSGRGVGLDVVKTVIERCSGTVAVDSEPGAGTTFTLRLPVNSAGARISEIAADNQTSVLIVDDSRVYRRKIADLIESAGWQTQQAGDGIEALDVLSRARKLPRVILTDAEMPRMNGCELLENLKRRDDLLRIPVILITSRVDDECRRKAFDAGAHDYLIKGFDPEILINKIKFLTGAAA